MGSSDRLFNRQRTIHQILGGGLVADVMLWRQSNLTVGILVVTLAAWVVFERSGYTLLSLTSSVFLLLFTILFLWAKSAAILNRPAPPLPHLYLSEEITNEAATFIRNHVNVLLSVSEDIALGKDSRMFIKVALCLSLISVIGSLTDFLTLFYTGKFIFFKIMKVSPTDKPHPASLSLSLAMAGLVIVLTVPALCERYEDHIDRNALIGYRNLQLLYVRFDAQCISKVQNWILEKKKLS